jgi:uncharacterized NAD(P)/FAD-binding protein YdhS
MGRTIAIVGAGFTGALLTLHLLRRCSDQDRVLLIEKSPRLGAGLAYSTGNPNHLLNVRAGNMSAFSAEPNHFVEWLRTTAAAARPARRAARAHPLRAARPPCHRQRPSRGDHPRGRRPLPAPRHGPGVHGRCRGAGDRQLAAEQPLLKQLLADGLTRPDALKLGLDVSHAGALIGGDGRATGDLFAVGPITRGTFWEIVAVPDLRVACERMAELLLPRAGSTESMRESRALSKSAAI